MITILDVQTAAWRAVAGEIAAQPEFAIFKKWLNLKANGTAIGVPVTPELTLGDGTTAQAFSSGFVLHWTGGDNVELI